MKKYRIVPRYDRSGHTTYDIEVLKGCKWEKCHYGKFLTVESAKGHIDELLKEDKRIQDFYLYNPPIYYP